MDYLKMALNNVESVRASLGGAHSTTLEGLTPSEQEIREELAKWEAVSDKIVQRLEDEGRTVKQCLRCGWNFAVPVEKRPDLMFQLDPNFCSFDCEESWS